MIPCKDCLILPMCRHKEEIKCILLNDWMEEDGRDGIELLRYLPNWLAIVRDHKVTINIIERMILKS